MPICREKKLPEKDKNIIINANVTHLKFRNMICTIVVCMSSMEGRLMMIVQHNMVAMFAQNNLKITNSKQAKNMEKLSSGYRINRSADDAAGLKISEKMRSQIRGLDRAGENIEDGISFIQTGEGALGEVHSMLHRIRVLAVQASNDTNNIEDREAIDQEVQQIKREMNRVYRTTEFNKMNIFKAPDSIEPEIDGEPNDVEFFNAADGVKTAGVIVNGKRYTYGEIGVSYELLPEEDFYRTITDPDNPDELIRFHLKAGETPDKLRRIYEIKIDEEGVLINDLYAGKWNNGSIQKSGDYYTVNFHGMDLSFEADDEVLEAFKKNDEVLCTFESFLSGGVRNNSAVSSTRDTMTLNVTNSNKDTIENFAYQIKADNTGVALVQTTGNDGITHSKTNWGDFTNTDSGEESYPISDWGVTFEGNNPVTLNSEATYKYTDSGTAGYYTNNMSFKFNFNENEVSRDQAISALTQNLSGSSVSSPIASVTVNDGVTLTSYSTSALSNFHFQRDKLLRDFGSSGSSAVMNVTVERTLVNNGAVTDHELRKELTQAYVKRTDTYREKTTEVAGAITGKVFYINGIEYNEADIPANYRVGDLEEYHTETWGATTDKTTYHLDNGTYGVGDASIAKSTTTGSIISDVNIYDENDNVVGRAYISRSTTKTVTDERIASNYDTDAYGKKKAYVQNGGSYTYVSDPSRYIMSSGDGLPLDTSGNKYSELTDLSALAGTQRYVETGAAWIATDTYDLDYYTYSGKNSAGTEILSKSTGTPQFLNVGTSGVTSIGIHDENGVLHTYKTENHSDVLNTTISSNDSYGINFGLNYTTGIGNRSNTIIVTPSTVATRTFTKAAKSAGTASDTKLNTEIIKPVYPDKLIHIQAGANVYQSIDITYPVLSNSIVGISGAKTTTYDTSQATIAMADTAINFISEVRSKLGAYQNRLEHAYNIAKNVEENTQAAESIIRDTDMAKEMMDFAKNNILEQAGTAMVANANQQTQGVLNLLRG